MVFLHTRACDVPFAYTTSIFACMARLRVLSTRAVISASGRSWRCFGGALDRAMVLESFWRTPTPESMRREGKHIGGPQVMESYRECVPDVGLLVFFFLKLTVVEEKKKKFLSIRSTTNLLKGRK
jgi:hypothetical protein